jgi:transposase
LLVGLATVPYAVTAVLDTAVQEHGRGITTRKQKACKASKARKPHLDGVSADEETDMLGDDGNDTDEEDERPSDCCMRRLLLLQSDFAREKSQLELVSLNLFNHSDIYVLNKQLIEAEPGMVCHFLPKFHPEMNPIEYFWAWVKRWFRERSNGTWQKAKDLVSEGLRLCPLPTIRRFYRRADCYASVYHLGATGPITEFAVKRCRSHRGVRAKELDVATAEWHAKAKAMAQWSPCDRSPGKRCQEGEESGQIGTHSFVIFSSKISRCFHPTLGLLRFF